MVHLSDWVARRFRVGFFGEFSAGKSTLINSLLGVDHQDVSPNPTTDRIHILYAPGWRKFQSNGLPRHVSHEIVSKYTRIGVEFWDSPGSNAERGTDESLSLIAAKHVDITFFLVDATQGVHRSVLEQFNKLKKSQSDCGNPPPFVALCHYDRLGLDDPEEEAELQSEFQSSFNCDGKLLCLNATDLTEHDGPRFRKAIRGGCVNHMQRVLVEEIWDNLNHPIRRMIERQTFRMQQVPRALRTAALQEVTNAWIENCEVAREQRDRDFLDAPRRAKSNARKAVKRYWRSSLKRIYTRPLDKEFLHEIEPWEDIHPLFGQFGRIGRVLELAVKCYRRLASGQQYRRELEECCRVIDREYEQSIGIEGRQKDIPPTPHRWRRSAAP